MTAKKKTRVSGLEFLPIRRKNITAIQNILFDMGNVLLEWNARKNIAQVEPDAERADKLEKVVFTSGIWERQDTGELTVEEALNLVKE